MAGTALATPIAVPSAAVLVVDETHPGARARRSAAARHPGDPSPGCPRGQTGAGPPRRERIDTRGGTTRASWSTCRPGAWPRTGTRGRRLPPVGTVAATSKYYGVPIVALGRGRGNAAGTGARSSSPTCGRGATAGSALDGLAHDTTCVHVESTCPSTRSASTSATSSCIRVRARPARPRPRRRRGDYVVTDRVPFPAGSALGSFAFGISGIQPRLPAGWCGRQPARDPRHERPLVDRYERLGRLRPRERMVARAFQAAAAARHARRHPRLRR